MRHDIRIGGCYTAVNNGDGTYDILDVPIFAEVPPGTKRNKGHIGQAWQEAALLKSRQRESEGHLPPVHIYHSDEQAVKPIYAGKLRLKAVKQHPYEGEHRWTTFADIVGMPGEVFSRVEKGFLPYRSVEIHNWDNTEIDSLALMDTDVPFFRMPMLTIGKVLQKDSEMFMAGKQRAHACRVAKGSSAMAVLFRFDDEKKEESDEKTTEDPPLDAAPEADKEEKDETEVMEDKAGETGKEDETSPSPEGARPQEDTSGPVLSMMESLNALMQQILQRLGPQAPPNEKVGPVNGTDLLKEAQTQAEFTDKESDDMDPKKDPKAPAPAEQPVTFASKGEFEKLISTTMETAVLKATTPLLAEINALKAKETEREKTSAIQARFNAAKAELEKERCHVDPDMEKQLFKCAEIGEDFLKDQVALLKSRLPKDPPPSVEDFEREAVAGGGFGANDAVNKFVAEANGNKAELAAWAKQEAAKHARYVEASGQSISLEEWLTTNFRARNMYVADRV